MCQRLLADDPTRGGDSLASFKVPMEELPKHFSNFRRHMNSERHVRGLLQWQSEDDKVVWAPPAEEFRACLENLRKGGSARGGGTSDKATLMRWCLSEAILQRNRSFLRLAKSLVLVRDERHGQLLLRFRATLSDMSVVLGVLGVQKLDQGSKARDILKATEKALEEFATPCLNPPRLFRGTRGEVDQSLLIHLKSKCDVVVTDCASAEILAQDMGRGARTGAGLASENLFPNTKIVGRDRAHACQRLLSRPWKSDDYVKLLMEDAILGKDSACQKIWHSETYSCWFAEAVKKSTNPKGCTMSAAKHRFCSLSKPLGRFILHLEALAETLSRIAALRSEDSGWAVSFMEGCTSEGIVILAMCADMSAAFLDLTRFFDQENMDVALMNMEVGQFIQSLEAQVSSCKTWIPDQQVLFGEGQCFHLHGFTKHAIDVLRAGKVLLLQWHRATAWSGGTGPCQVAGSPEDARNCQSVPSSNPS